MFLPVSTCDTAIYSVEYGLSTSYGHTAYSLSPGSNLNFTLGGLNPGSNYTIYIKGNKTVGDSFTTTLPASTPLTYVSPPEWISTNGVYCTPRITLKKQ